jgi:hypothetical protein
VEADVNVMPFCSQFIPMEVINYPKHQSICYHPSILPRHRGASAINWYDFDEVKDLVTPNISACRKIDNVLLINVLFIS